MIRPVYCYWQDILITEFGCNFKANLKPEVSTRALIVFFFQLLIVFIDDQ